MKNITLGFVFAVIAVGSLPTGNALAQSVSLNFNSTDTFTTKFNQHFDPHSAGIGAAGDFTWQAAGGISDSGGAPGGGVFSGGNAGNDESAIYNVSSFNLSTGVPHTISMFVKDPAGTNANARPIQLGFINGSNLTFNGNAGTNFLSVRIRDDNFAQLQTAVNGTTTSGTALPLTFTAEDWLKLSITFALTNPVLGTITYSFLVEDYGPTGVSAPTVVVNSGTQTVTDEAFAGTALSTMFAGFRTNSIEQPGFDNFSVAVPEPASALTLALAGTVLLQRRARRKQR